MDYMELRNFIKNLCEFKKEMITQKRSYNLINKIRLSIISFKYKKVLNSLRLKKLDLTKEFILYTISYVNTVSIQNELDMNIGVSIKNSMSNCNTVNITFTADDNKVILDWSGLIGNNIHVYYKTDSGRERCAQYWDYIGNYGVTASEIAIDGCAVSNNILIDYLLDFLKSKIKSVK